MKKYFVALISILIFGGCKNDNDVKHMENNFKIFNIKQSYMVIEAELNLIKEQQFGILDGMKWFDKRKELSTDELAAYNEGQIYIKFTPTAEDIIKSNKIIWIADKVKPLMDDVISLCDEYNKIYTKGKTYNNLLRVIKHSTYDYSKLDNLESQIDIINKKISTYTEFPTVSDFTKEYKIERIK
jgi:hypothetical protein